MLIRIMTLKTQPNDICFEPERANNPCGTLWNSLQIVSGGWVSFENLILLIELKSHYANRIVHVFVPGITSEPEELLNVR